MSDAKSPPPGVPTPSIRLPGQKIVVYVSGDQEVKFSNPNVQVIRRQ